MSQQVTRGDWLGKAGDRKGVTGPEAGKAGGLDHAGPSKPGGIVRQHRAVSE